MDRLPSTYEECGEGEMWMLWAKFYWAPTTMGNWTATLRDEASDYMK